jgi:hypothetical protein
MKSQFKKGEEVEICIQKYYLQGRNASLDMKWHIDKYAGKGCWVLDCSVENIYEKTIFGILNTLAKFTESKIKIPPRPENFKRIIIFNAIFPAKYIYHKEVGDGE